MAGQMQTENEHHLSKKCPIDRSSELKKILSAILLIMVFGTPSVGAKPQKTIPTTYQGNLKCFITPFSQSNWMGKGPMPPTRPIDPMAWNFNDGFRWMPVQEPNELQSTTPVDLVNYDTYAGYGPTLAFTLHLHAYDPEYPIGMITTAKGGSSQENWIPSLGEDTLYGAMVKRIAAASVMCDEIVGAIVFQGEAETFPGKLAQANMWSENFALLVAHLREDYGENLPVVFMQLPGQANQTTYPYQNIVMAEQVEASQTISNVYMVPTFDLPTQTDRVHLKNTGYNRLGCRVSDVYSVILGLGDGLLPCVFNTQTQ